VQPEALRERPRLPRQQLASPQSLERRRWFPTDSRFRHGHPAHHKGSAAGRLRRRLFSTCHPQRVQGTCHRVTRKETKLHLYPRVGPHHRCSSAGPGSWCGWDCLPESCLSSRQQRRAAEHRATIPELPGRCLQNRSPKADRSRLGRAAVLNSARPHR